MLLANKTTSFSFLTMIDNLIAECKRSKGNCCEHDNKRKILNY